MNNQLELFDVNIVEPKKKRIRRTKAEMMAIKDPIVRPVRQSFKWLQNLRQRWFYYLIGSVDVGVGMAVWTTFAHILIFQIPFCIFGAALTIGRVQAYRYAPIQKTKRRKDLFLFCWILGVVAGTYQGASFEIELVNAQHISLMSQNGEKIAMMSQISELEQLQKDLPRYDQERSEAIKAEAWNTRDQLIKSIDQGHARMEYLQNAIQRKSEFTVSAKTFFGELFGVSTIEYSMRIFFISIHIIMEMILALFAKPITGRIK